MRRGSRLLAAGVLRLLRRLRFFLAAAAKDYVDARHQLTRAERLGNIVVAAHLQTQHTVDLLVARGEEEDRHVRGAADLPADLEAIHLRHADIEHDERRLHPLELLQRGGAVIGGMDLHAGLLQREADHFADMRIVVGNEDAVRHV